MKPRTIWLAALLTIVLLATAVAYGAWSMYRWANPAPHVFAIDPSAPLTEQAAIDYTRRALVAEGKDSRFMRPMPYWHDGPGDDAPEEPLFSRNTLNANQGTIIWSGGYGVNLERDGSEIKCWVHKHK